MNQISDGWFRPLLSEANCRAVSQFTVELALCADSSIHRLDTTAKLRHYQLPSLLDMRPALALLHGYDKQSVGELVGSTVETSRCGPGENRSLAEGVGSNRWQPGSSHKEWCSPKEGQTQRCGQSQNFSGDESPVEKIQGPEGQEVNHRPLSGDLRAAPAGS